MSTSNKKTQRTSSVLSLESGEDDPAEIYFSSSSYDRSSNGSIPWAEDAIKQNQEEWEHVERMFYGEDDLPKDMELRREIIEWIETFPHLRITGTKLPTIDDPTPRKFMNDYEIFSLDPSNNDQKHLKNINELTAEFEKDLCIRSVPKHSRLPSALFPSVHHHTPSQSHNLTQKRVTVSKNPLNFEGYNKRQELLKIPSKSTSCLYEQRRQREDNESSKLYFTLQPKKALITSSAQFVRMPPILKYSFLQPVENDISKRTRKIYVVREADNHEARTDNQQDRLVLPPLKQTQVRFQDTNGVRSISAAHNHPRRVESYLYAKSASKAKKI